MKPALTVEEWKQAEVLYETLIEWMAVGRRHSTAALCLHGQPFGFRREMVDAVALLVQPMFGDKTADGRVVTWEEIKAAWVLIEEMAANVAALLPPEDA